MNRTTKVPFKKTQSDGHLHSTTEIYINVLDPGVPADEVVAYDVHQCPNTLTNLSELLQQADPSHLCFRQRHYTTAGRIYTELGSCASQLYWRHALADANTVPGPTQATDGGVAVLDEITKTNGAINEIISRWTFEMPNTKPTSLKFNVSPKFAKLVEILKERSRDEKAFRAVILGMATKLNKHLFIY